MHSNYGPTFYFTLLPGSTESTSIWALSRTRIGQSMDLLLMAETEAGTSGTQNGRKTYTVEFLNYSGYHTYGGTR
jgi:hypothetical protein